MKKWQAKHKQRAHDSIIQNAKSTIRRYSHSKQHALSTSRAKNTPVANPKQMPINKILQIFQLEQYAFLLAEYGFPHKLVQKDSRDYIDDMLQRVDELDQQRFLSLLNTLTIMSKDFNKIVKTPTISKSKKSIQYVQYAPHSVTTSKQTPTSLQKSQKTTSKFRIKNNGSVSNTNSHQHQRQELFRMKMRRPPKIERERTISNKYNRKKSVSYSRGNVNDDFSIVHDFRSSAEGEIRNIKSGNHLIQRLVKRLEEMNLKSQKNIQDLHFDMQKIKQMYISFDSAKVTSNITNIDLQLMIQCLSEQIIALIHNQHYNSLAIVNQEKIKNLLKQSFLMVSGNDKNGQFKDNLKSEKNFQSEQLPTSQNNIMKLNPRKIIQSETSNQKQQGSGEDLLEGIEQSLDQSIQIQEEINGIKPEPALDEGYATDKSEGACSIQLAELASMEKSSSIWGNSFIQSVIKDFSCFDSILENSQKMTSPEKSDIKNFIELVVMAGKMEKQIPIIAHVYLKRLLRLAKGSRLSLKNWKNITLILLIEASKIWDDQSLQNHSFSKIVKPYTTLEINRLQKYLLFFIDYKTTINQKQYSQSYFQLRKYSKQCHQTANLMKLDLRTIQKLQMANNAENRHKYFHGIGDKKQFMKRIMNKSF